MPNAYSVTTCSLYTESDTDVPMCEHSSTLLRACHMLCCSVVCLHGLWCGVLCVLATSLLCASFKAHAMVLEEYGGVRRITEEYGGLQRITTVNSSISQPCYVLAICCAVLWCADHGQPNLILQASLQSHLVVARETPKRHQRT